MFHRRAENGAGRRRGYIAVLAALMMIPFIGILALAIDGGMLMAERRKVQATADAAVQGAAVVVSKALCAGTTVDYTEANNVALAVASKNGYANDGVRSSVLYSATQGAGGSVSVTVTSNVPRYFSAIWSGGAIPVVASSQARWPAQTSSGSSVPASSAAIIALDKTASGALTVVGSAQLVTNAVVQVDSTSTTAFAINNSGKATASTFNICGNYKQDGSWSPITGHVNTAAKYVADPLATLAAPSQPGTPSPPTPPTTPTPTPSYALQGYGSQTIYPGTYLGGLTIGGGQTITMSPGIYYMKWDTTKKQGSFTIANGATVTGSGVMVYVDSGGGGISFQGGGRITLSPPTTGTYTGVVMYIDRNSTKGTINIANGSTTTVSGTVYAPSSPVIFAGGASYNQMGSQYICDTLNLSNNAYIGITWSSSSVASQPPRPAVPAIVQ
jgi:hypothetical protein